jgi:hypothetical protein
MWLFRRRSLLALILVAVTGCSAVQPPNQSPVAGFPYRHATFDLITAWQTSQTDQGVAITGLIKNRRYQEIDGVDLTVSLRTNERKVIATAGAFPLPSAIKTDYYSHFDLLLNKATITPGDLLQFVIRYRVNEGGHDSSGNSSWLSSFEVDAVTGAPLVREEGNDPGAW